MLQRRHCVTASDRVNFPVNRLKIPQGLSTLLFRRWSEVPSRGGVRGNSPYEKRPVLQRRHCVTASDRVNSPVNRLKIPQGLSTLLFRRWSEVPSRGGVRGDSPYEKRPVLQRRHCGTASDRVNSPVNRLKIPQGLSTLLFHRWSEVPSRGGVRGDSP